MPTRSKKKGRMTTTIKQRRLQRLQQPAQHQQAKILRQKLPCQADHQRQRHVTVHFSIRCSVGRHVWLQHQGHQAPRVCSLELYATANPCIRPNPHFPRFIPSHGSVTCFLTRDELSLSTRHTAAALQSTHFEIQNPAIDLRSPE